MCLAIPGKVLESFDMKGLHMAKVRHGGIVHDVCLEYVPEAKVGEYVIVHAGFAITKVDGEEAARTYELLEEMGQLVELSTTLHKFGNVFTTPSPGPPRLVKAPAAGHPLPPRERV
jgi:hydrogenase expression/formation protein HypC